MTNETSVLKKIKTNSRNPTNYDKVVKANISYFPFWNESRYTHTIVYKVVKKRDIYLNKLIPKVTTHNHQYDIYIISTQNKMRINSKECTMQI